MELDLTPKEAQTLFEGDGGGYYVWSSSEMPVLANTNVGAGRLVLQPRGFALPHYADSSKMGYVVQGSDGVVGIIRPETRKEIVLKLKKGDIIPAPIGSVSWWFNDGDSDLIIVFLGETDVDFLHEEDNEQLEFDALEHLENPDLHVDSVRAIKLYTKIKDVLIALECPKKFSFNLADLLKPDPQRTEFFLGALLNYCLDREGRMESISAIVEEFNQVEAQLAELEDNKILELKLAIAECNEAEEKEMPLVQEVEAKIRELKLTITSLNNKQGSLRSTLKKLKDKTAEVDDKIRNAEYTMVQNHQENANLRSKIAQSPDKVQRALEEKKLAREEARNAERLAMHTFHEKSALVEVYSKVYKKMSKHYSQMQSIQEQVNSAKSIEKELKALKAKLSDEEVLEKSLEAKLVERQSKVEHMEESTKQLEKEYRTIWEEATNELNRKKSEVESKRSTIEMRQRNVEAVLSKVDTINSNITSVKESTTVKVEQLGRKCGEVVEEFQKYANSIERVISFGPRS